MCLARHARLLESRLLGHRIHTSSFHVLHIIYRIHVRHTSIGLRFADGDGSSRLMGLSNVQHIDEILTRGAAIAVARNARKTMTVRIATLQLSSVVDEVVPDNWGEASKARDGFDEQSLME